MGNHAKYLSYKTAWERINRSIASGYHLEAVALCEGIISDRLVSYVQGESGMVVDLRTSLSSLISRWRKLAGPTRWRTYDDLPNAVNLWRKNRNLVVHGLVKSAPGRPTRDVSSFLELAEETAVEGRELARAVSEWHKSQLRRKQSALQN